MVQAPNAWAFEIMERKRRAEALRSPERPGTQIGSGTSRIEKVRMVEPDWREIALHLAQADAEKAIRADAAARGLAGSALEKHVQTALAAGAAGVAAEAQSHIDNVLEVAGWKYVACHHCLTAQWAKLMYSALDPRSVIGGQACTGCGKWLDERKWRELAIAVCAPPDGTDEDADYLENGEEQTDE